MASELVRRLRLVVDGLPVRLWATGEPADQAAGRPWLLAVHGAGGGARHWLPLLRLLARERLLALAPDLPGHGGSAARTGEVSIPAYAAWLGRLLDALAASWPGLGRPWLAGHSMGGAIAQEAALAFPERLAGLVLVATGARLRVAPAFLEQMEAGSLPPLLRAPSGEGPGGAEGPGRAEEADPEEVALPVALADFLACDRFDRREAVGAIRLPTLVIHGEADPLTPPRYGEFLASRIPGARLERVPGAGHFVLLEAPEACAEAILAALRPSPGAS
ncbi:MAG: alpha/beta hydrolase [Bacillota bacterium]|nr:alpha/beta hydrolase [Bacillota bacterium]